MDYLNATSPEEMYIALHFGFYGGHELLDWCKATSHLDKYADDWEVSELLCASRYSDGEFEQSVKRYFGVYRKYWNQIEIASDRSENIVRRLFAQRLEEYLNGKCRPNSVCRAFRHIEDIFDYPDWLGDMYNACDWVERETTPSECPYLAEEAARLLPTLPDPKHTSYL